MKEKRELAYWGAGDYGKLCVEYYPNIRPDFFIDSNRGEDKTYCGIPIKTPDEVRNWNEVFVVITTTAINEIEKVLNEKKLIRNENYAIYKDFFAVPKESLEEKVTKVKKFIEENAEYERAILIVAPVFISRVSGDMIRFFRQYGIKRKPQKCILFTDLQVVKEEEAKRIMGYPVFDYSELCEWNGMIEPGMEIGKLTHEELLSENEKKWILELEERKLYEDKELSYRVTAEIYWYFKNIFSLLKPSKVILWSGWVRQSCILARLAKASGIIFGYMEHGWIPGTFQFDRYWMEDQYKYNMEPEINLEIESKNINIRKIRDYILDNKIDTGKYRKIENDERSLQRIDRNRKTIFFVGMDDRGLGMNPQSDYWKKYILPSFSSTAEAALFTSEICSRNGWNFVFKPHPNSANQGAVDRIDSTIIQVRYTEIDRLIQLADVVVSIASKVDYKVLMYGKPLVKLGRITLYKKGCFYEAKSKNQIEEQIKTALDMGMTEEQNKNFEMHMAQLLEYHLWDDLNERELRYGLSLEADFFDIGKTE